MEGIILKDGKLLSCHGLLDVHCKLPFLSQIEFDITDSQKSIKNIKYIENHSYLSYDLNKLIAVSSWAKLIIKTSPDSLDGQVYKVFIKSLSQIKEKDVCYANAYFHYTFVRALGVLPDVDYKNMKHGEIVKLMESVLLDYTY